MHFTGQLYRPPVEYATPLLELTSGCSHNACSFCVMYDETPFRIAPDEQIKADLDELAEIFGEKLERIYLTGGDPFALSYERLARIAKLIRSYFPNIRSIACYAAIRNILDKSTDELRNLKDLGFNHFYVGIETGHEGALALLNKGCDLADSRRALGRLRELGIRYNALLMLGIAGVENSRDNAEATAALLNDFPPYGVSPVTTVVQKDSPLADFVREGRFHPLNEGQILDEELLLLEALDLPDDTHFFGSHHFNLAPISGPMKQKSVFIAHIKERKANLPPSVLKADVRRQGF